MVTANLQTSFVNIPAFVFVKSFFSLTFFKNQSLTSQAIYNAFQFYNIRTFERSESFETIKEKFERSRFDTLLQNSYLSMTYWCTANPNPEVFWASRFVMVTE